MGLLSGLMKEAVEKPLTRKVALGQLKNSGNKAMRAFADVAKKVKNDSAKTDLLKKHYQNFKRSYTDVKSQISIMPESLLKNTKSVEMRIMSKKLPGAKATFSATTGKTKFYSGATKTSVWHEIGVHGTQLAKKNEKGYKEMWEGHKGLVKDKVAHSKKGYKGDKLEEQARMVEKKIVEAINFGLTDKALERSFEDMMRRSLADIWGGS